MLTILGDPAGITGRRHVALHGGATLLEQIAAAMPEGGADCAVRINGVEVDPLTDPRFDAPPVGEDDVVVAHRPGADPFTWALVISLALSAYTYSLIPKPTDQPQQTDSPNNRLTGQSNIARAYQAIPDVYGLRRVWPDLLQPSVIEYISNVKVVTEWLCVSRGLGTITADKFADTPVDDIGGATWTAYQPAATPNTYAEDNSTTLPDVYEVRETPEVNGQELADSPSGLVAQEGEISTTASSSSFTFVIGGSEEHWASIISAVGGTTTVTIINGSEPFSALCAVDSHSFDGSNHTFGFTRPTAFAATNTETVVGNFSSSASGTARGPFTLAVACDQIWCNFAFLRGLVGTVQIEAEWWAIDSAGVTIDGTTESAVFTFIATSFEQQFFTEKIIPAAGLRRYRIQFARLTADIGNGADVCKIEEVYAVRYYATKTLPGVTVVKVKKHATAQALGGEQKKWNCMWQRHVRTLTSTTVSASRNFARAFVHLWAISGNDVAELDTAAMQSINTALGEDSPMLRFDASLDDANLSLGERLQIIANVARCVVWRDGTLWTLTRDQARTTPELQLDYRNLASSGESGISYAAHLPASHDGIELEYVEEVEQKRKEYVRLDISSGSVVTGASGNAKKVKLIGCATQQQALNRADLEARKLLYQRTSVGDTALSDAASLGPASLVRWIDPHDFYADDGLQGGEVLAISGSTVTTSEPLQWGVETSGRMYLTGVDGQYLNGGAPVVVTPAANGAVLASVPSGIYVRDDTRQLGSRFAFGAGLSAAEIAAAGLYTVTEVKPSSNREVSLSMVNYDARLYVADNTAQVGAAAETDTAFALGSNAVGLASEIDRAAALAAVSRRAVGMASEVDAALALPGVQLRAAGLASETDTALAL